MRASIVECEHNQQMFSNILDKHLLRAHARVCVLIEKEIFLRPAITIYLELTKPLGNRLMKFNEKWIWYS